MLPAWADRPRWLAMMRASIEVAAQAFTSDRMARDYVEQLYRSDDGLVERGPDRRTSQRPA